MSSRRSGQHLAEPCTFPASGKSSSLTASAAQGGLWSSCNCVVTCSLERCGAALLSLVTEAFALSLSSRTAQLPASPPSNLSNFCQGSEMPTMSRPAPDVKGGSSPMKEVSFAVFQMESQWFMWAGRRDSEITLLERSGGGREMQAAKPLRVAGAQHKDSALSSALRVLDTKWCSGWDPNCPGGLLAPPPRSPRSTLGRELCCAFLVF